MRQWLATCLLFFAGAPILMAQHVVIQGFVRSLEGTVLQNASVYVSQRGQKTGIAYSSTSVSGEFRIQFIYQQADSVSLNVRLLGYKATAITLPAKSTTIDIVLIADEIKLNEVVIRHARNRSAFNDTTTFVAKQFVDGTQASLEDVLKKIPGFSVEESGKIFFKGREISAIHLDGDDLTGNAYSRISRNLRPSLIESIQAIERFVENPLLGGLTGSQATVLNITVPPDRKKLLFGDVSPAYGIASYRKLMTNVFSYGKKTKLYLLGTHNNIGERHSIKEEQQSASSNTFIRPVIPPLASYPQQFRPDLTNLNNETTIGLSVVHKPTESLKIVSDVSVFADHSRQQLTNFSQIRLAAKDSLLELNQVDSLNRHQLSLQVRNQLNLKLGAKTNLVYELILGTTSLKESNSVELETRLASFGLTENIEELLENQPRFQRQKVVVANRLNQKSAVQVTLSQTYDRIPQGLSILATPERLSALSSQTFLSPAMWAQKAKTDQSTYRVDTEYFRAARFVTYSLVAGAKVTEVSMKVSDLGNTAYMGSEPYMTRWSEAYGIVRTNKTIGSLALSGQIGLNGTAIRHLAPNDTSRTFPILYPTAQMLLRYSFNQNSEFRVGYDLKRNFSQANDLLVGPVTTDYRNLLRGISRPLNQQESILSLFFNYNDYAQITMFELNAAHIKRSEDFVQNIRIDEIVATTSLAIGPATKTSQVSAKLSHFFSALSIRVGLETSLNHGIIFNSINNSGLRRNILSSYRYALRIGTGFNGPVNVYCGIIGFSNRFRSLLQGSAPSNGSNTFAQSDIQIRHHYKNFLTSVKLDNLHLNKKLFSCLDAEIKYTPINSRFDFSIKLKNLTNTQIVENRIITDRQNNLSSYALIPRLLLGGFDFRF